MVNYFLIIPFVIILIAFIPIKLHAKISFNVLDFSGAFGIFLFKKKVEHQQFWIKGKKILTKKEDEIESNLNIISPENISFFGAKVFGGIFLAFILLLNGSSISSYHRKQETELQVNQLRPEHIRNGPLQRFLCG